MDTQLDNKVIGGINRYNSEDRAQQGDKEEDHNHDRGITLRDWQDWHG